MTREPGFDERRIELAVPIRRPPAAVFALLADVQDYEPLPRRETVRMVKDPPGPTAVGTRWHEWVRLAPGCWLHTESVVAELAQPRRLGMDFRGPGFGGRLTYDIEPTDDGCLLHHREELRLRRSLRWLGPALERSLRPHIAERLQDIRALLEDGNGGAPPASGDTPVRPGGNLGGRHGRVGARGGSRRSGHRARLVRDAADRSSEPADPDDRVARVTP